MNQERFEGMDREFALSPRARTVAALLGVAVIVVAASVGLTLLAADHGSTPVVHVRNLPYGVFDTFRRADAATGLGQADSGQKWYSRLGTWGVKSGEAYVAVPRSRRNSLAVVDMHTGDGTVQVTVTRMVEGAGLVFRYQNDFNYYAVVAAPKFATWGVLRIDHGKLTQVGHLGVAPVQNQTTVSVQLRGTEIDVAINGQLRKSFPNNTLLQTQPYVGLIAYGSGARNARWVNFVASGAAAAPAAPARRSPATPRSPTAPARRRPAATTTPSG